MAGKGGDVQQTSRVLLDRAMVMLAAQPLGALAAKCTAFTLCFARMTCRPGLIRLKHAFILLA